MIANSPNCEVVWWKWNTNKISQEAQRFMCLAIGISYVLSNPIRNIINDPCFSIRTYYVIKETLTLRKYDIVMIIHMLDHVWIDIVCNLILQLLHKGASCQYFFQWHFLLFVVAVCTPMTLLNEAIIGIEIWLSNL